VTATPSFDVLVIGAGAMGAATAWWLVRNGRSVCVLERYWQGHDKGSSHGSSRVFRLAYPDPLYVRMAQQALPLWRELEDETRTSLLTTMGGIDHGADANLTGLQDALRSQAAACELLSAAAARERWPQMRFKSPVLYQPDAGRIDADATVRALHNYLHIHGAQVHVNEPVQRLEVTEGAVLAETDAGTYRGATAVVAAGAWTETLLAGVVELPALRVVQAEVFHFLPSDTSVTWPTFNQEVRGLSMYGLPTASDGIKVAEHRTQGPVTTADSRSFEIEAAIRDRVRRYVQQWLPGLEPTVTSEMTCLYTMAPGEDFIIDRVGPLVVGSTCSGHGFKFTPLIGQMLANAAVGDSRPDTRFALR